MRQSARHRVQTKASESSSFLTGLCVAQFHGMEGPCGKICKVQFPGMSWATWKNMVAHKTCFQSLVLQNMARTCGKSKALKLEGGLVSLLLCILEGSSQHSLSQLWLMVSPWQLCQESAWHLRPRGMERVKHRAVSYHALWCVSNLSSKYSTILGNLAFWITPLVSIPELIDVFLSQFWFGGCCCLFLVRIFSVLFFQFGF